MKNMTKKLVWRLMTLPTASDVEILLKGGVISKEEARSILFKEEEPSKEEIGILPTSATREEIMEHLKEFNKTHGIAFVSQEEAVEYYRSLVELIENLD